MERQDSLGMFSDVAQTRIKTAEDSALEKLGRARLYQEQVTKSEELLASLEFSIGVSEQRSELKADRARFGMNVASATPSRIRIPQSGLELKPVSGIHGAHPAADLHEEGGTAPRCRSSEYHWTRAWIVCHSDYPPFPRL